MDTAAILDSSRLWNQALKDLQIQMSPGDFRMWFADTQLDSSDGPVCVVSIQNPLTKGWLETKCRALVARTLEDLLGRPVQVEFAIRRNQSLPVPDLQLQAPLPQARGRRLSAPPSLKPHSDRSVSARFTFDNFVVGPSNRLAYVASLAAARQPGVAHNPLFIYGGAGLGKTHLLHAVGHHAVDDDRRVVYVSSETFTNEFIESVGNRRMEAFRERYRRADLLLIDDVQFIAGKEVTQEEFFHTFNAVFEYSGQIVLASDRAPKALTLAQRLRSRFGWGLVADIQEPDLETRIAILRAKLAARDRCDAPIEVLSYIAERMPSNVRDLEGALNRVLAQADLLDAPVNVDLAKMALEHALPAEARRRSTDPEAIIKAVCHVSGMSRRALEGAGRDRRTANSRQLAMYLLREHTALSLSEIGSLLGGRDHTTVLHGHSKMTKRLPVEEPLREAVAAVRRELDGGS
ncbi:MAG: chromosomal replication initiator protein DnaA [Chloroflexi bacterium]|nr:chromosomal replication initiator protein DnaA [Chloroflexota bacterium]